MTVVQSNRDQAATERRSILLFVGAIAALILASVIYASLTDDTPGTPPEAAELPGVATFDYRGGSHTTNDVTYAESPPVGLNPAGPVQ